MLALLGELLFMKASKEREAEITLALKRLCPDPYWSDCIFHSREFEETDGSLDIEVVINKVFNYKPI